ncbi:uncharacterized protein DS421_5g160480 [Arachis hypogaea]|nr:uncharacterized protein DS421_5g160480 [Arachis hypogaea]
MQLCLYIKHINYMATISLIISLRFFHSSLFLSNTQEEVQHMEIVDCVPVCGNLRKHTSRRGTYHILKNHTSDDDYCNHHITTSSSNSSSSSSNKMVQVIPPPQKVQQPKSTNNNNNILKRVRDAYIEEILAVPRHMMRS